MNRLLLAAGLALISVATSAQFWTKKSEIPLSDTLQVRDFEWMALNADTVLDLTMLGQRNVGTYWLLTFERVADAWAVRSKNAIALQEVSVQQADWNKDGRPDALVRGRNATGQWTLTAYESQGDFTWRKQMISLPTNLPQFRVADADGDGRWDFFLFGKSGLELHIATPTGFEQAFERKDVDVRDFTTFRFFRTHILSWVVSGRAGGVPVTRLFVPDNNMVVKEQRLPKAVDGLLAVADYNGDGFFDLAATGRDSLNSHRLRIWYGSPTGFSQSESRQGLEARDFFAANLNEDRGIEQVLMGTDSLGKQRSLLIDSALRRVELPWAKAIATRFADLDRDGDLDGFVVVDSLAQQWLQWHENKTEPTDQRPSVPTRPAAFSLYGRTLLFWQPAQDDRTASESITYDVWLGRTSGTVISSSFDLTHYRRTAVASGNAGNTTVFRVRQLTDDRYFYTIQAVDNALNGSYQICSGGVLPCFDLEEITRQVCQNAEVRLVAPAEASWYSIRSGFLTQGKEYVFTAAVSDTLFSVVPQSTRCADHKIWIIQANPAQQSVREVRYVCENTEVKLGVAAGWPKVSWQTSPPIQDRDTIRYRILKNEKITVVASDRTCEWRKEFDLRISKPMLTGPTDAFRIQKGSEVVLSVTAGPGTLQWLPTTGLAISNAAATSASPPRNTEYEVTLTDSVGCVAKTILRVNVDFTAFIPNLFSPNADDSNDRLLLYGLDSSTVDFRFQIFNREGNQVYETEDPTQATTIGWNGIAHGVRQAAGLYYWKVTGKTAEGAPLLLNGKTSGNVLLVY